MTVLYTLLFFLFFIQPAHAAKNRFSSENESSGLSREILGTLQILSHEVANHEDEIRMFEEKFKTQEEVIESLRYQLEEALRAMKETIKGQAAALDNRLFQQENSAKGISTSIKAFSAESASALADYKNRIVELEKIVAIQNRNIDNLQSALRSLTDAWQESGEGSAASALPISTKVYMVKAGDSLEKIARHNQTTIKKLKEINSLASDQIIIGQKIQIPE